MKTNDDRGMSRRAALRRAGLTVSGTWGGLAALRAAQGNRAAFAAANQSLTELKLPPLLASTEVEGAKPTPPLPEKDRVGFAIVGLGHLALTQILPAFGASKFCRPVALVSGDRAKAQTVAAAYGIDSKSVYDYGSYDRLRDDARVRAVYVVLPNGMHAEYSVRAFQAGKHVLCEKPMANTVAECEQMIEAGRKAGKKLMIAYRMQYEPYNREAIRAARAGELGVLKSLAAVNGQAQGDPNQWRLKRALAGGGSLPDVGIYCLNAARYLSGEEPIDVSAFVTSTANDPRFKEVEEQVDFLLRFPSGFTAACTSSYGFHDSKRYRLVGAAGWLELDPAFPYVGQMMRVGRKVHGGPDGELVQLLHLQAKNQFALELDHMASCIRDNKQPHTPGEEGMQDMRIVEAIYRSARDGRSVRLPNVAKMDAFRGAAPV